MLNAIRLTLTLRVWSDEKVIIVSQWWIVLVQKTGWAGWGWIDM